MKMKLRKLPATLWAGFCDGKIDLEPYQGPSKLYGVLYASKRAARECYQDVRRVLIIGAPDKPKKRGR